MKVVRSIENNKKVVIIIMVILLIPPIFFQLVLSSLPPYQRFIFVLYSILFLLIGYIGISIVLGIQVFLKLLSKKTLNIICNFFIIFPMIMLLLQYPMILRFIHTGDEAITIAFIYVVVGVIIGSNRIKNKYTIE